MGVGWRHLYLPRLRERSAFLVQKLDVRDDRLVSKVHQVDARLLPLLFVEAVILTAPTVQSWIYVAAVSGGRRIDLPYLRRQLSSIAGGAQRVSSQWRCEMNHTAHYFGMAKEPRMAGHLLRLASAPINCAFCRLSYLPETAE
jgi:hypothetical protein